jgi:hypothetical protein
MFLLRHEVEPSLTLREGSEAWTRAWYRYANDDDYTTTRTSISQDAVSRADTCSSSTSAATRARASPSSDGLTQGTSTTRRSSPSARSCCALPGFLMRIQGQRWGDYDNLSVYSRPSVLFFFGSPVRVGERKRETLTDASATLSRDFGDHWTLATRYSYFVNQSTVDAFDYNRSIYSLFASYRF